MAKRRRKRVKKRSNLWYPSSPGSVIGSTIRPVFSWINKQLQKILGLQSQQSAQQTTGAQQQTATSNTLQQILQYLQGVISTPTTSIPSSTASGVSKQQDSISSIVLGLQAAVSNILAQQATAPKAIPVPKPPIAQQVPGTLPPGKTPPSGVPIPTAQPIVPLSQQNLPLITLVSQAKVISLLEKIVDNTDIKSTASTSKTKTVDILEGLRSTWRRLQDIASSSDQLRSGAETSALVSEAFSSIAKASEKGSEVPYAGWIFKGIGLLSDTVAILFKGIEIGERTLAAVHDIGNAQLKFNFQFAQFSPSMARVSARQQFREHLLSYQRGEFLAPSAQRLADTHYELERKLIFPATDDIARFRNEFFAWGEGKMLDFAKWLEGVPGIGAKIKEWADRYKEVAISPYQRGFAEVGQDWIRHGERRPRGGI